MLVDMVQRGRPCSLRRNMLATALAIALSGCPASFDPGEPLGAAPPELGREPPSDSGAPSPSRDAGAPAAHQSPPAPPVTCEPSPLPLTRFPTSLRTTASGRTFTGWGGAKSAGAARRPPIIFIHGNGGTGEDFKPFRQALCKAGYGDLELWAITFQDHSCMGACSSGSNTQHAAELDRMVELVRSQTGATRVSLVGVSLGATTARYYIKYLGGLKRNEVALAYLVSGPNHGLKDCDLYGASFINVACAELDASALKGGWLFKLNVPDETPSGHTDGVTPSKSIIYRTVSYLKDPFFPSSYVSSPKLEGADNLVLPGSTHADIDLVDLLGYLKKVDP